MCSPSMVSVREILQRAEKHWPTLNAKYSTLKLLLWFLPPVLKYVQKHIEI